MQQKKEKMEKQQVKGVWVKYALERERIELGSGEFIYFLFYLFK